MVLKSAILCWPLESPFSDTARIGGVLKLIFRESDFEIGHSLPAFKTPHFQPPLEVVGLKGRFFREISFENGLTLSAFEVAFFSHHSKRSGIKADFDRK